MRAPFPASQMVNEALIARCARQETKAQYELYEALYPAMMSICRRYERDMQTATALMNQGFLKIFTHIGDRRPEVPFEAWTRRIMLNTVIDEFRKDRIRKHHEHTDAPLETPEHSEVNTYLASMEAESFAALLEQVPQGSRNVFNLFAIDGFSHAEIAEMLDISVGTSKWHVANARTILQQAIAKMAVPATARAAVS